jgi:hypothetical protein
MFFPFDAALSAGATVQNIWLSAQQAAPKLTHSSSEYQIKLKRVTDLIPYQQLTDCRRVTDFCTAPPTFHHSVLLLK